MHRNTNAVCLTAIILALCAVAVLRAQPNPQYAAAPTVTGLSMDISLNHVTRVWSDGLIESRTLQWTQTGPPQEPHFYWLQDEWQAVSDEQP